MTLDGIFVSALANRKDESRFRIRYFVAVVLCFICVCYCFRGRGSKLNGLCSYGGDYHKSINHFVLNPYRLDKPCFQRLVPLRVVYDRWHVGLVSRYPAPLVSWVVDCLN